MERELLGRERWKAVLIMRGRIVTEPDRGLNWSSRLALTRTSLVCAVFSFQAVLLYFLN